MKKLTDFAVLTLDCYGTLIDWESGIWDAFQPLLMHNESRLDRQTALRQFAVSESEIEKTFPTMPYPELLQRVHGDVARAFGLATRHDLDHAFGQSMPHWPAFPDTADALRILKQYYRLVILSNVDDAGLAASQHKLGVSFDAVYTAGQIGSYKPADANFEFMLSRLAEDFSFGKADILHTAQSLHHDHMPAKKFALSTAWIDRQNLTRTDNWGATVAVTERPEIDFLFPSLGKMAQAVASEFGSGSRV